jgi:phage shock protein PspC (stress-responsive transcriptional regulator)
MAHIRTPSEETDMTPQDETPQDPQDRPKGDEQPAAEERPAEETPAPAAEEPTAETREQPPVDGPQAPSDDAPTEPLGTADNAEGPRRLVRSRGDRVIGGVAAGVARYFNIDPVIVRVVFVALTFIGGAGLLLYLAALLLVPDERGHVAADASSFRGKVLIGVAGVLLFVAIAAAVPWGWGNWFLGGFVFPVAFLALLGLGAWWLVQGRRPGDDAVSIVRAIVLGLLLLVACALLAVGAAWATAVGGGEVVAGMVIAAGAMLVAGAFVARVRWLILPALSVGLALGLVSATGIEVDDSVGERDYRPTTAAAIHDQYELGVGSLVVDLRDANLGAGAHRLKLKVGVGEAVLLVPDDVCVTSEAQVGLGAVDVFDRNNGGVDVDWDDPRDQPPGTPTVVVDAEVGIGQFHVDNTFRDYRGGFDHFASGDETASGAGFKACDASA